MNILIATAGALPPSAVADLIGSLWSPGTDIHVMTSIEVPRSFLEDLETEEWRPFADQEMTAESERAVQAYVDERGHRRVEPVLASLDAAGFVTHPLFVESGDPTQAILDTIESNSSDLLIMGATRPIFNEDVWQSVAVKVMQSSPIPVVMVPAVARSTDVVAESSD